MEHFQHVYFIGIGGIGMSALARYFNSKGKKVSGYDRTHTALTAQLEDEGIAIHYKEHSNSLSESTFPKETTLVVYTPAVPKEHSELVWFQDRDYEVVKRSKALGIITDSIPCIAVAGTHGKTTTSCMIAHIFHESGHGCNAFLGGIASNYDSNLLLSDKTDLTIVEADEYDRSFLTLHPDTAIITSIDADHLDIYGSDEEFLSGFQAFSKQVKKSLLIQDMVNLGQELEVKTWRYGFDKSANYEAQDIRIEGGSFVFDLRHPDGLIHAVKSGLPGIHNVENSVAAIASALQYGLKEDVIKKAVASFRGVYRRFDRHIAHGRKIYIDDYAHHPTEIDAIVKSVRMLYPNKKVLGIFQPHLFSRTRDFGDDFARSLAQLDEIILLDIYPARELPITGIDSQWLFDKITHPHKNQLDKSEIFEGLGASSADIVLTLGAGDIDRLVKPIKQWIEDHNKS